MPSENVKLNKALLKNRGISEKGEKALVSLHTILDDVIDHPEEYGTPNEILTIITEMEYAMQAMWKFPKSAAYHRHSYRLKECTCPHLDNLDMVGYTTNRRMNTTCPYHSTFIKDSK